MSSFVDYNNNDNVSGSSMPPPDEIPVPMKEDEFFIPPKTASPTLSTSNNIENDGTTTTTTTTPPPFLANFGGNDDNNDNNAGHIYAYVAVTGVALFGIMVVVYFCFCRPSTGVPRPRRRNRTRGRAVGPATTMTTTTDLPQEQAPPSRPTLSPEEQRLRSQVIQALFPEQKILKQNLSSNNSYGMMQQEDEEEHRMSVLQMDPEAIAYRWAVRESKQQQEDEYEKARRRATFVIGMDDEIDVVSLAPSSSSSPSYHKKAPTTITDYEVPSSSFSSQDMDRKMPASRHHPGYEISSSSNYKPDPPDHGSVSVSSFLPPEYGIKRAPPSSYSTTTTAPTTTSNVNNNNNNYASCAICLEKYVEGDTVMTSSTCGHMFHRSCLLGWATTEEAREDCPICRQPMWDSETYKIMEQAIHQQERQQQAQQEEETTTSSFRQEEASMSVPAAPTTTTSVAAVSPTTTSSSSVVPFDLESQGEVTTTTLSSMRV